MVSRQSMVGVALLLAGCASPSAVGRAAEGATKLRGDRGYVVAYRREGAIVVGAMAPDRSPMGGLVTLSHAAEESDPIVTPQGDGALIAWSERDHEGDAWRVRLIRWIPGGGASTLDERTMLRSQRPQIAWARDASGLDVVRVDDGSTLALAGVQ